MTFRRTDLLLGIAAWATGARSRRKGLRRGGLVTTMVTDGEGLAPCKLLTWDDPGADGSEVLNWLPEAAVRRSALAVCAQEGRERSTELINRRIRPDSESAPGN